MQILALGCSLPDPQVDNYDWGSAPSLFDYDAMIVDPAVAVSELVEGVLRQGTSPLTYSDEPIEDGPTTATSIGLADLLRRRQDETQRLLSRGGLIVCFAQPDVPHPRVSGFPGCHRLYWLPAPEGRDYGPSFLRPAHGVHAWPTDYEHPFADFLERQRNKVSYRALFTEGASGFAPHGRVIGRSPGGAAIALDVPVGGGRVIFLPALPARMTQADRSGVAASLVTAVRNALLTSAEGSPPEWVADYPLPGIEAAEKRIEEAESQLATVEAELEDARNEYRGLDRFRRLLWQEGKYGFELPVRDALALLGFTIYTRPDEAAVFHYGGETVLVESESSPGAVGMEPHYRLRQRLETEIASSERRRPGIIVINGYREQLPEERPQQYEESLRIAAESMRYCVVEATQLFAAVRDHFEGRGDKAAFCRALVTTEGVLSGSSSAAPAEAAADQ